MIYYFSATGNSKWIAKEIAAGINDEAVSITKLIKTGQKPQEIGSGEVLGLVFPIYAWDAPELVANFVRQLKVDPKTYIFFVCTCGSDAGKVTDKMRRRLPHVDAAWSIRMPNDYLILSDLDSHDEQMHKIKEAEKKLPGICIAVKARRTVTDVEEGKNPLIRSYLVNPFFRYVIARDKKFTVKDSCDGCGICEHVCPKNNIRLHNGKPVWQGNCMHCTACINRCPDHAIEYGDATRGRDRYRFDRQQYMLAGGKTKWE